MPRPKKRAVAVRLLNQRMMIERKNRIENIVHNAVVSTEDSDFPVNEIDTNAVSDSIIKMDPPVTSSEEKRSIEQVLVNKESPNHSKRRNGFYSKNSTVTKRRRNKEAGKINPRDTLLNYYTAVDDKVAHTPTDQ